MTPKELTKIGEALFASRVWKDEVAKVCGVKSRTVRRWATGENEIPEAVGAQLLAMLEAKIERLQHVAEKLSDKVVGV